MTKPNPDKQTEIDTVPAPGPVELKEDLAAFRIERRRHYLGKVRVLGFVGIVTVAVAVLATLDMWSQTSSNPLAIVVFIIITLLYFSAPFFGSMINRKRLKRWNEIAEGKEDGLSEDDR